MNKKPQFLFWIGTLSVIASIGIHVYLTNHHYQYKFGQNLIEGGLCNINDKFNCNATTASEFSEMFGVPISIFGGLVNFMLLCMLLAYRFPLLGQTTQTALQSTIKAFSLGIFGVSIVMGTLSLLVVKTICPMCAGSYLTSFIAFMSLWSYFGFGFFAIKPFDVKVILTSGLTVLAFGFLIHTNKMRTYGGPEITEILKLQLDEWKNSPEKSLVPVSPLTMNASADAKIKLVEFADFLCGHCATAYPIIHAFVKNHPDVELSFQAFPLDGECNSAINFSEGTRCYLASVSQCAGQQGKGWETQEWLFANQQVLMSKDAAKQKVKENAAALGLNEETLNICIESEETRNAIKAQAKLGSDVGIQGTPSLFINGKKVPSGFNIPLLETIYREIK